MSNNIDNGLTMNRYFRFNQSRSPTSDNRKKALTDQIANDVPSNRHRPPRVTEENYLNKKIKPI